MDSGDGIPRRSSSSSSSRGQLPRQRTSTGAWSRPIIGRSHQVGSPLKQAAEARPMQPDAAGHSLFSLTASSLAMTDDPAIA
jgi:hypothetical protein